MSIRNKYIVWSILIIVGLILFLICPIITQSFWNDIVKSIAGALLISGTFAVLHSIFERKEEEAYLEKMLSISSSIKDSGLLEIMTDSKDYSFTSVLSSSKQFTAILNDGRTWVLQHFADLKNRFDTEGTSTEILLVDPDGLFIPALAQKTVYEVDKLKEKIKECVGALQQAYDYSKKKVTLTISFLKNYPTLALYFADDRVIVTPYQVACGRNVVPAYVYSYKNGHETIGEFLVKDLKNVKAESRMFWNNGKDMTRE